jgi:hypothetical protein
MVSSMESDEFRQSLREVERGEASTWIDYPPVPAWWAPFFGLWTFVFGLNLAYVEGPTASLVDLALVVVTLGLVAWQRRTRGTYPTRRMPRELVPSLVGLLLGVAAIGLLGWLVGFLTAGWVAAIVAGLAAWALVARYEAAYARVAQKIRARLA